MSHAPILRKQPIPSSEGQLYLARIASWQDLVHAPTVPAHPQMTYPCDFSGCAFAPVLLTQSTIVGTYLRGVIGKKRSSGSRSSWKLGRLHANFAKTEFCGVRSIHLTRTRVNEGKVEDSLEFNAPLTQAPLVTYRVGLWRKLSYRGR